MQNSFLLSLGSSQLSVVGSLCQAIRVEFAMKPLCYPCILKSQINLAQT